MSVRTSFGVQLLSFQEADRWLVLLNATLALKDGLLEVSNDSFHQAFSLGALLVWVMMPCTSGESDLSKCFFPGPNRKIDLL